MERMGSFRSRHAKSSPVKNTAQASNSNTQKDNAENTSNTVANAVANSSGVGAEKSGPLQPCMVREQDQYMPIANVIRIMRRILPPHAKISDDAKETIQECVSEYISFITGEANERCQREQRKTVTAEDVLWAMGKLGFDNYVEPLTIFLNRYRDAETDRGSMRGDMSFVKRELRAMDHYGPAPPQVGMMGPPSPYGPMGFPMGPPPPPPPPPHPAMFEAMAAGYFRDGSGAAGAGAGSSSSSLHQNQNALGAFDPFAQFK